jgi:hypothetical protein
VFQVAAEMSDGVLSYRFGREIRACRRTASFPSSSSNTTTTTTTICVMCCEPMTDIVGVGVCVCVWV